tara:strand:- start:2726 stop:2989 length:264 start_codon:yes stop_codon:yes gene_type:complete
MTRYGLVPLLRKKGRAAVATDQYCGIGAMQTLSSRPPDQVMIRALKPDDKFLPFPNALKSTMAPRPVGASRFSRLILANPNPILTPL